MFADPRFAALGHRATRASRSRWDALSSPWQTEELDTWMNAARVAGVDPLVSFGHSRTDRRAPARPPSASSTSSAASAPATRGCTSSPTWNEANHCGEPTCHRPRARRRLLPQAAPRVPDCRILAAEVLDMPNMVSWVRAFRRHAHEEPRYWGLHNYIDANRVRTTGTRRMLQAVEGPGLVHRDRRHRRRAEPPQGDASPSRAQHAATATRFLFDRLVPLSRRVTRVYIYHWNADAGPGDTWDSALIGPTGRARPALKVVARVLQRQAARRAARAARRDGRAARRRRRPAAEVLLAIISDTHLPRGARRLPDACVERLRSADLILHAGDFVTRRGARGDRGARPAGRRRRTATSTSPSC